MKALIIYVSISRANTKRVAKVIAEVLAAPLLEPEEVDISAISDYDLIGFGSGIYYNRFYKRLRNFTKELPILDHKKAFLFATGGHKEISFRPMEKLLVRKGFDIMGEFYCPGYNTWLLARLFGRQNKGRPNTEDFKQAEEFAKSLKEKLQV